MKHDHNEEVTVIVKAHRVSNLSVVAKSPPHGLSRRGLSGYEDRKD